MAGNQLPDPQTAYQNIFDGVHQRVFFHKLAQLGYVPTNEKQAAAMLELAGNLRMVEEEAAVKQAESSYDPFEAANDALKTTLGQYGFSGPRDNAANEEAVAIKQAAAAWSEDPDIYNSVLALKAYEAEQAAAQLGIR